MSGARHWEQDKEATVYIGNLDERVTDALVWELMLQAGRIVNVHLPKDRVTQTHQGYGFVEFVSEEDAEYAARIMNQIRLYGKPIRVNKASADKQKTVEVGAELFIGNLDPMVTEQTLYDTFSRFGSLVTPPKVARDDSNLSKGYGFVSYNSFEASDDAVAAMNGQFLMNKEISVQYAYKKDGKGERHGDQAERMLAAQARKHNVQPSAAIPPPMPPPPVIMNLSLNNMNMSGPSAIQNAITPHLPVGFRTQSQSYGGAAVPPPSRPPNANANINANASASVGSAASLTTGASTLGVPPQGLPARPPPSQAGYGGPTNFLPPGFNVPPPGAAMPPGFGAPPPPPGFQNQVYGRGR